MRSELQSYFIQRIEKFLNDHGRKTIGWDEILEGGLSENATVQSWRGMDGGKIAAEQKHYVVMSPTSHCYLDYALDNIDLKKIYSFNPIPENLASEYHKYILGAECNMWTEHVPDEKDLDSKVFPRMIALAEMLWSGPDTNRYDDFYMRLQKHYSILELLDVDYGTETIPFRIETSRFENATMINISPNLGNIEIWYRWQNDVDTGWISYSNPIELLKTDILEVKATKNNIQYGEIEQHSFAKHQGLSAIVSYSDKWNEWYSAGGEYALVNGQIGTTNFRDGNWQGFWGDDLEVTLDLGEKESISSVTMHFLEYSNAWIMKPKQFQIYVSNDNQYFNPVELTKIIPVNSTSDDGVSVNPFILKFEKLETYFLKVVAVNYGQMPANHDAAGQDSWLFIDEIIVE